MMQNQSKVVSALIVVALGVLVFLLMLPAVNGRPPGPRTQCVNNLKQIGLALLNYNDVNGSYPTLPTSSIQKSEGPSWRVLILPYADGSNLFEEYELEEPWNGPNNSRLLETCLPCFRCPVSKANEEITSYVALLGLKSPWHGYVPTENTDPVPIVISINKSDIAWLEPRDIDVDEFRKLAKSTQDVCCHHERINVLFSDGSVRVLSVSELNQLIERFRLPTSNDGSDRQDENRAKNNHLCLNTVRHSIC